MNQHYSTPRPGGGRSIGVPVQDGPIGGRPKDLSRRDNIPVGRLTYDQSKNDGRDTANDKFVRFQNKTSPISR